MQANPLLDPQKPQIVVLAGGLGTRIRPITETLPKAMVPILGKPFIHHQLSWLARWGIRDIILSIGYLGHQIREFVEDGKQWGVQVRYVEEGRELRGTGGALRLVFDSGLLAERFLVTYGDSYLPIDYGAVWAEFLRRDEPSLMTVLKNLNQWDTSNAIFKEGRVYYDKKAPLPKPSNMVYVDYGLSAFKRAIIPDLIPSGQKYDLADVFHHLALENQLAGLEVQERFYEVGSLKGIEDLESYLSLRNIP